MLNPDLFSYTRLGIFKLKSTKFSMPAAVVAEWLRRLTRNQMGFSRAGSNPAGCGHFCLQYNFFLPLFRNSFYCDTASSACKKQKDLGTKCSKDAECLTGLCFQGGGRFTRYLNKKKDFLIRY